MEQRVLFMFLAGIACLANQSLFAQITLTPIAEAMVRNGANASLDMSEESLGYLMVKYSTAGSSGKSYFRFDFKGEKPNTNGSLVFTFSTYNNSQRQHVQLWSLNQDYPEFTNSVLIWNTAQANETNSNNMITNAVPYTATPVVDFVSPTGSGAIKQVTIPAPWGQYIHNQQMVIVLSSVNDPDMNQSNGLRIQTNSTSLTFETLIGQAPTISTLTDLTITAGKISMTNNFTLADSDSNLSALSLSATSSDESILPVSNIMIEGTGAQRRVYVTAGEIVGTVTITLIATDENNNSAQRTFKVTITPLDFSPSLQISPWVITSTDKTVSSPFTVTDKETPADRLNIEGLVQSHSSELLATVAISGAGSNRTVTITPVRNADGVGTVTLTATDESNNQTSVTFAVVILPSVMTVFSDHFTYPDEEMFASSAGVWSRRGGSQTVKLKSLNQKAWIRSSTTAEDGVAILSGSPFKPGERTILYTMFNATWNENSPVGSSVGPFLHLSDSNNANLVAGIATVTNDIPGQFRLRIANGAAYTELAKDLQINVTYRIVSRYDVDTAQTTLWVDSASETVSGVSATDAQVPVPITFVGLRQDRYMGDIYIDDLRIVAVKRPFITAIRFSNGQLSIDFQADTNDQTASFQMMRTTDLAGPYENINASTSTLGGGSFRVTVTPTDLKNFFRISRLPMRFD